MEYKLKLSFLTRICIKQNVLLIFLGLSTQSTAREDRDFFLCVLPDTSSKDVGRVSVDLMFMKVF
jgi:hypothetical protein